MPATQDPRRSPDDPLGEDVAGVTRLAPSPTGSLHLGNARTFLINWALAVQGGWRVVLRVEDLDTPRVKPGAIEGTIDLLAWLGLTWEGDATVQSQDLSAYVGAMERLASAGLAYPCELTRSEIEAAASAPQEGGGEARFDASLRPEVVGRVFDEPGTNWRLVVAPGSFVFEDGFAGEQRVDVSGSVGDFVVWTKRGHPSYQLAVTIDDEAQGVTHVVRGNDLIDSTGRQALVRRALGIERDPAYIHVPLVRGEDGRRLAKRHGDTRLTTYRDRGVAAERVIGLLASWCGLGLREPMSSAEFARAFSAGTMPTQDVTYTSEDEQWLLGG